MRNFVVAFVVIAALVALPSRQAVADDATYVGALVRKGYLQQISRNGATTTVTVGPKFNRLNAQSSKEEVCRVVLRLERLANPQIGDLWLLHPNGQPLGRFDGTRLQVN